MYKDDNRVSIFKIILRIVLFILIFLLVYKLISLIVNKSKKGGEDVFDKNITVFKDAGVKYAQNKSFNLNVNESKKLTLKELQDSSLVDTLKDKNNKECSNDKSYVEITRLENEYKVKVYLVCGKDEKDIYTYLNPETREEKVNQEPVSSPTTTTTTTTTLAPTTTTSTKKKTTKATTKKTTTTPVTQPVVEEPTEPAVIDYYVIGFNTNGGKLIDSVNVKKGSSIVLPHPVKEGYTFYRWEDSSGKAYYDYIVPTKDMVLIAKWR